MSAPEDELSAALTRLALAGDGLLLGVSMTVLAIRTWIKFWSHSKALKDIKETPLTRIADLRTLVKDTDVEPTETFSNSEKVRALLLLWIRSHLCLLYPLLLSVI